MAKQELDLVQFTTGQMAQTGARAPQVVWGKRVDARASRSGAHNIPRKAGTEAATTHALAMTSRLAA